MRKRTHRKETIHARNRLRTRLGLPRSRRRPAPDSCGSGRNYEPEILEHAADDLTQARDVTPGQLVDVELGNANVTRRWVLLGEQEPHEGGLAAPDGPMRKTNSPLSILTEMLSSAGRADDLYCLDTWSRVIITARQCSGDAGESRSALSRRSRRGQRWSRPGRRRRRRREGRRPRDGLRSQRPGNHRCRRRGLRRRRRAGGRRRGGRGGHGLLGPAHVGPRHPGVVRVGHEAGRDDRGRRRLRSGGPGLEVVVHPEQREERDDQHARRDPHPAEPGRQPGIHFCCSAPPVVAGCTMASTIGVAAVRGRNHTGAAQRADDQYTDLSANLELLAGQRAGHHPQVHGVEFDALHAHQLGRMQEERAQTRDPPSPSRSHRGAGR